jgi:hypothetical protein
VGRARRALILLAAAWLWPAALTTALATAAPACLECHGDHVAGFSAAHPFADQQCDACHGGDPTALDEARAHHDLLARPGELDNAARACGSCHGDRVASVREHVMHTGQGMVSSTRQAIEGEDAARLPTDLQHLGHGIADSLLRKQCANCHLGQPLQRQAERRQGAVVNDRGGGCLACHLEEKRSGEHGMLTARVSDARCFGCHSRSGRISLSYVGLAELDAAPSGGAGLSLPDGRPVERRAADAHYAAGMGCIDCHTARGLMGSPGGGTSSAIDIACGDCHANDRQRLRPADWPAADRALLQRVPFTVSENTEFLATARHGSPLWHVELRDGEAWLHSKTSGRLLRIPPLAGATCTGDPDHARLACDACHSQWAPQCYGCHLEYDPEGRQWDHVERAVTGGRWTSRAWGTRNGPPALGVRGDGRIAPFVPGMIMTLAHQDLGEERFLRRFAPLAPHTTGPSRSCESCHRSPEALGFGSGHWQDEGRTHFRAVAPRLRDGLPADAWHAWPGASSEGRDGPRPLSAREIGRVLGAELPAEAGR